jgi:hypothetical protein
MKDLVRATAQALKGPYCDDEIAKMPSLFTEYNWIKEQFSSGIALQG